MHLFILDRRLYWVNVESHTIQFYDFVTKSVASLSTTATTLKSPSSIAVLGDKLYWADHYVWSYDSIHVVDKTTGTHDSILRSNIDHVYALKIYDPELHLGTNIALSIEATVSPLPSLLAHIANGSNLQMCRWLRD